MTIAARATGCEHGFVYLRGEYPLARERLEHAIAKSRGAGLLDGLDLEVRSGAGAYVCGEETALFESIEGKRGEPRKKPPFPVEAGLFGKPTLVNNVETLVAVLDVVREGGEAYARLGTPGSTGTRLFCLSGHVGRPGVYEVELGTTLRDLLELAGTPRPLQAVLLGGAAGTFLAPDDLDLRLTFEDARAAGTTLGSGVVMAFDETADLADAVLRSRLLPPRVVRASACRAGSAPCGRRKSCSGWRAGARPGTSTRSCATSPRSCATRPSAGSARPARARCSRRRRALKVQRDLTVPCAAPQRLWS